MIQYCHHDNLAKSCKKCVMQRTKIRIEKESHNLTNQDIDMDQIIFVFCVS